METLHHAIMTQSFAEQAGLPENMCRELTFWSAMPDVILGKIGYEHRAMTHLEDDAWEKGGQLHLIRDDLSELYAADDMPKTKGIACAPAIGWHLHLLQDREYDKWISSFIRQEKKSAPIQHDEIQSGDKELDEWLNEFAAPEWKYYRVCDGKEISNVDVALLKRWSWRCGYVDAFGDEMDDEGVCGAGSQCSDWLLDRIESGIMKVLESNSAYEPWMREKLFELWDEIMEQKCPPKSMLDLGEEMLGGLKRAWVAWK